MTTATDSSLTLQEEEKTTADQVVATPAPARPSPTSDIPDGGLEAYLQVLGAALLFFNSWGIINTFGVYQEYYETAILSAESPSTISWIGTIQGFLLLLVGMVTGPIFDRGHLRLLILAGTLLVVFGMMMTSLGKSYYQIVLSQGVCVGIGAGCLFMPSIAIMPGYFSRKRALMTGIAAAGGSIGGIIYPIVFRKLQPMIGFGWSTRIIGFMALALLCIPLSIMHMRTGWKPPKEARALLDLSAFKEALFNVSLLAYFVAFIGLYFPFFYAPIYGTRVTHLSPDISFYILPVMNAGSIAGRIVPGLLADRYGSLNMVIPHAFVAAVLAFAWIGIKNAAGLWVFSALYGYFSGAMVSLPPTIVALITPDLSRIGTRMGMSFAAAGLGILIGNPIAGAILSGQQGKFSGAQIFAAVMLVSGAVMFSVLRLLLHSTRKAWKA